MRYWTPFLAPCLGTIARIVRSNKYTVVISLVDNAIPHEKHFGDRLLTKYFLNSIDGAAVLSDTVQRDVNEFRNDIPVSFAHHPLFDNYGKKVSRDEAMNALKLDPDFSYLLFFGFIRDYKGLDILLKAFSHPDLKNKKLKLLVAGEFYENESLYRKLAIQSGRTDDIVFFNRFIDDEEVKLFFSAADLVVQPYKTASQSGVTQIAYYFDKPMLVTNVGGLKETVPHEKCGYVVQPEPEDIAKAIIDYFENNRKEAFTECVVMEKQKFSWSKMTDAITEVFYRCLLKQLITAL
jgi:glycosyltransferase involved in cell wall biosynthesis